MGVAGATSNYVERKPIPDEACEVTKCVDEAGSVITARVDIEEETKVTVETNFNTPAVELSESTGIGTVAGCEHADVRTDPAKSTNFETSAPLLVGTSRG